MSESACYTPAPLRLAAGLIGCAALLEVGLVTHHPVIASLSQDAAGPFGALAAIMQTNLAFHAILMLVAVGQLLGLLLFARRLGLGRPLVLIGSAFCSLATVLLVTAMTFDGFVVFELISRCQSSQTGCAQDAQSSLRLVAAIIQGFTKLGFGAQCLGFTALGLASWSFGRKSRIATVISVMAATAPMVILTSGTYVGPQQLTRILALLAVWGLCVAFILVVESPGTPGRANGAGSRLAAEA